MGKLTQQLPGVLLRRAGSRDKELIAAVITRELADGEVDLDLWNSARQNPAQQEQQVKDRYVKLRAQQLRREMRTTMDALATFDAADRQRQQEQLQHWLEEYRQTPEGRQQYDRIQAAAQYGTLRAGLVYWLIIGTISAAVYFLSMR